MGFMRAVCSCVHDLVYRGRRGEEEDSSGQCYRTMSSDRQEEIDNLRKIALLQYLSRFTLVRADYS